MPTSKELLAGDGSMQSVMQRILDQDAIAAEKKEDMPGMSRQKYERQNLLEKARNFLFGQGQEERESKKEEG